MTFASLGLIDPLLRALDALGYKVPTPVQVLAIPAVLGGRDLLAAAQTGTGKTAGFSLPLLQRLAEEGAPVAGNSVRALVLVPTRELAEQVCGSIRAYGQYLPLRICAVYGGVSINPQMKQLRKGMDVVVATPGRLLDLHRQNAIRFGQIRMLVLDEADRMLDMGFMPDLKRIIGLLPAQRQNLMFSATFPQEIESLARSFLKNPQRIEVARRNATAENVTQVLHPVHHEKKRALLIHLIRSRELKQVLVFTGTKLGANRLAHEINKAGIHAAAIHGDKTQQERIKALDEFKSGEVGILVATDVAARGLDISALPYVVNFDLPHNPEDYVHRIGRTGRAGASGEAISLMTEDEARYLKDIEKLIGKTIDQILVPGYSPGAAQVPDYRPPAAPAIARPVPVNAPSRRPVKQVAALFRMPATAKD